MQRKGSKELERGGLRLRQSATFVASVQLSSAPDEPEQQTDEATLYFYSCKGKHAPMAAGLIKAFID
jgi:hypothetical protein